MPERHNDFLLANLNHSARAQDLLMQHMAEWQIKVVTAAEPYFIPPQPNWAGDTEGSVAIVVPGHGVPLVPIRNGPGFVTVGWGELILIGVYFSPNRPLSDFESYLRMLEPVVRGAAPAQVILMGDLNAKSAAWGSPITDLRGVELQNWAAMVGLVLLNRGRVNTCVRQQGGSIRLCLTTDIFGGESPRHSRPLKGRPGEGEECFPDGP
ncbi:uncharacterized protein LOC120626056 [Pararge aegeria]|uniref:uncharacterized protein LOC120626056 n=1 Tax=Pararge aegeria TaxID=116150 RepID=UPI0019CFC67B|nr:uncharacterized protein LOC120626056 [Pararge aegeria]